MNKKDIEKLSFEEAISQLDSIVKNLEGGTDNLDKAISHYSDGMLLKNHCLQKLADAKLTIEKIQKNDDGNITSIPTTIETS